MPIYLVRHGQAQTDANDQARSLTEEGKLAVHGMAQLTAAFAIPVAEILHSGKTRARETAEIMAHYLKPSSGIKEIKGFNPQDDVSHIATGIDPSTNTMLVGHLPFLESLVSYLLTGIRHKTIVRFQTGGIVCLDKAPAENSWYIKWALMPEMK